MEFLRKLLLQTQTWLRGLTVSQRLAIASCAGMIVISLLWLVNWASEPALVPLLDQPMTADELGPIQQKLDIERITYKLANNTIYVPEQARPRLLAQLGQQKALPSDISIGFAKLMEDSSPWLSMEEQSRRWSIARSYELSRVLREFDGVLDARVLIDDKTRRTIGQAPVTPTASVFVKMRPGVPLDKERVYAMASFVSRAVAGLNVSNVAVTDATTGRSYSVPSTADSMAFDDLEDRQKKEEYFANKIKSLLANIPGLLVAVHAELDHASRRETIEKYGKPVQVTEDTETQTTDRGMQATGPGVVPNTSRAVPTPGVIERTERTMNRATFDAKVDVIHTTTEAPRHGLKSLSASVNVPRSYLAAIYRAANNNKEPTDAELESSPLTKNEREKIKRQVERALAIPAGSDSVVVDWFHDDAIVRMGEVMEAGAPDGLLTYARLYGGKVGIGMLAVFSLFMMLMMVRKVGEGPVLPGEEPPVSKSGADRRRENGLIVATPPIGEADESETLMVAKELDEHTLRTQQVVEQVVDMIKADPDGSVSILRRWIDADRS